MYLLIDELRPNNWFLSQEKIDLAREASQPVAPVQVARIDGEWALLDGHSRAYVAWERGAEGIEAIEVPADHPVFEQIHREQRVHHISELRILAAEEFKTQWLELCYLLCQPGRAHRLEQESHFANASAP
jgi:hypothetical protein